MHRSEAEGRFGEAEPAGRASVCARTSTVGVFQSRAGVAKVRQPKVKLGNLQGKEIGGIGGNPAKANPLRLRIFYTFYMFYTAITTVLQLQLFF